MKRILIVSLILSGMISVFALAADAEAQLKLAYVRSGYILTKYEPYGVAIKKYEGFERAEVEKLQKKAAEFQQKVADSQKQASFMTEEKIRERSIELERENAELEKYSENLYNREKGILTNKYAELLKPVFDNVNKAVFQVRKEEGIAFIFEAESDAIIDADEKYDISDKVIERLSQMPAEETKKE